MTPAAEPPISVAASFSARPGAASNFDVEVFFDGLCPLCAKEIGMLRRLDRAGRVRFTDIAAAGFDAAPIGVDWPTLMDRIHGRLPDGRIIEGVEVFRQLYTAVGFGPLVRVSRLPGVAQLLNAAYSIFARHRLRLTGRCTDASCDLRTGAAT